MPNESISNVKKIAEAKKPVTMAEIQQIEKNLNELKNTIKMEEYKKEIKFGYRDWETDRKSVV